MSADTPEPNKLKKKPFPLYVFFILTLELFERLSFYGFRSILVLYLVYFLEFDESTAIAIYHGFVVTSYFTPIIGSAVADSYWGKYKTAKIMGWVFFIGSMINSVASINFSSSSRTYNSIFCLLGLFIMAFGTGGIKPLVSPFGADQFDPDDEKNSSIYFEIFYWVISVGAVISTLITPIIRQTTCGNLGTENNCYFIAFLVPTIFMLIGLIIFISGNRCGYYKKIAPSGVNVIWESCKCIFFGIFRKVPEDAPKKYDLPEKHKDNYYWLYGAYGKVKEDWIIRDIKYLLKFIILLIPLPIFWAAFDQQTSRWTLQAVSMNGYILGQSKNFFLAADQAQIINVAMILVLIPLFNRIYKIIETCCGKLAVTPIKKIVIGMLFAAGAYLVSALVQSKIDIELTPLPEYKDEISLSVLNLKNDVIQGRFVSKDESNTGKDANWSPIPDFKNEIFEIPRAVKPESKNRKLVPETRPERKKPETRQDKNSEF